MPIPVLPRQKKLTSRGPCRRVDRRSRPVIGPFSMAGLLGSRCFSERLRLREGKGEMRVFQQERWWDPKEGWKIWKEIVGWILIRSGQIKNRPLTSFLVCLKFEGFMIVHKQEKVELDGRKHMVLSRRFQRFC